MSQQAWYALGRMAVAAGARLMLDLDIAQHAPLPAGPKIIAADHPTTTDPLLITLLTAEPLHILITEMCFKLPGVSHVLRRAGQVPVVAGRGGEAFDQACRLLETGHNVAIFPAGALSPLDGSAQKPHTGVARLALASGAPVVPVGIALQREHIRFVETTVKDDSATARWYLRGPYAMTAGAPMYWQGDIQDRAYVRAVAERIMQRIVGLSRESALRISAARASVLGLYPALWASAES